MECACVTSECQIFRVTLCGWSEHQPQTQNSWWTAQIFHVKNKNICIYIYIYVNVKNSTDLLKESRCPLEGNDAGSKYIVIALWLCRKSLMISVEQRQTETEPLCAAQMSGVQRSFEDVGRRECPLKPDAVCPNYGKQTIKLKTVRKNGWPKFWKTHSKWIIRTVSMFFSGSGWWG